MARTLSAENINCKIEMRLNSFLEGGGGGGTPRRPPHQDVLHHIWLPRARPHELQSALAWHAPEGNKWDKG